MFMMSWRMVFGGLFACHFLYLSGWNVMMVMMVLLMVWTFVYSYMCGT